MLIENNKFKIHEENLNGENKSTLKGMRKWCQEYANNLPISPADLQLEVDKFMKEFDRKEQEEKDKAEEMDGIPDEDGWVKVTSHGRNKGIPRVEGMKMKNIRKIKKLKKKKELLHFYAWQEKNTKKEQILELQKKFEEDKQKIALMKAARKFKPF